MTFSPLTLSSSKMKISFPLYEKEKKMKEENKISIQRVFSSEKLSNSSPRIRETRFTPQDQVVSGCCNDLCAPLLHLYLYASVHAIRTGKGRVARAVAGQRAVSDASWEAVSLTRRVSDRRGNILYEDISIGATTLPFDSRPRAALAKLRTYASGGRHDSRAWSNAKDKCSFVERDSDTGGIVEIYYPIYVAIGADVAWK